MNVSIVSVSRLAGPSQVGQVTFRKSGSRVSGFTPTARVVDRVGQQDRQVLVGHRHDAATRRSG